MNVGGVTDDMTAGMDQMRQTVVRVCINLHTFGVSAKLQSLMVNVYF